MEALAHLIDRGGLPPAEFLRLANPLEAGLMRRAIQRSVQRQQEAADYLAHKIAHFMNGGK